MTQGKWRTQKVESAGGIVYRRRGGRLEVVLCGQTGGPKGRTYWGYPKGTPDRGESLEEAARREVQEETGLQVCVEGFAGRTNYWFARPEERVRYNKTVHYYLMVPTGGRLEDHDAEFDEVRWFEADELPRVLTYKEDVELAKEALRLLEGRQTA